MLDQIDDPERATLLRGLWQVYRFGLRVATAYRVFLSLVETLLTTFVATIVRLVEASIDIFTD
ncbi:hypothetical protein SAMN05216388_102312 [Halorientalis persicus]|uniref:Uncharacterized protein n=1 Tax=Halorientalis persicus TaxID=1367881 RepID=A0A1H8TL96_9EURY|nr:hypothetical protein [Halorientalis persicus]SEO91625.1 hypothetical protein SAMN05216388_102312 [Halorientalis persicus]